MLTLSVSHPPWRLGGKLVKRKKKKVSVIIFRNSKSEFLLLFENLFPLPLFKKFTSKMQRFRKFRKYSLVIEEKGNPITLLHRHDCFYHLGVHPYWLSPKPIFKLQWNDVFACRVHMHTMCVCTWSMWVSPKFVMAFKFKKRSIMQKKKQAWDLSLLTFSIRWLLSPNVGSKKQVWKIRNIFLFF